ncbi:hypothetical protein C0993_003935 [Termitomyces sp. T159_Od127]|nr:hypothetical protein C0993_003935 [Termitomyces sp. T159_Od127]
MASDNEDYSELTDLSSDGDGDDYRGPGSSKTRKQRSSPSAAYRIRNPLKVPRATTYTAQALYGASPVHPAYPLTPPPDQMHSDDIKLDPEYQRDVVWPDTKMVGLIDSVFRNFYVPPVIFSVVSCDDGSEKRICIDGKQRLTSIQRFMDGLVRPWLSAPALAHVRADPTITSQKLWYTDTGAGAGRQKKKLLPLILRKLFANKQIVCVEYTDVTDHDEREIFQVRAPVFVPRHTNPPAPQRVQLGMALTPAEKLQVVNTPRSAFIRALLAHFLSPTAASPSDADGAGSLAHFDWERTRGADFRALAQTVYVLHTFPAFAPPGRTTDALRAASLKNLGAVTTLEKFLADPAPFAAHFEDSVRAALRVVGAMAADRALLGPGMEVREVFRRPTRVAPVELVLVGLLVGAHMAAAGCTGASGAGEAEAEGRRRLAVGVRDMRAEVRETHVDIRMNARVARTMVDFVRRWRPGAVGAPAGVPAVGAGKRKRAALEDAEGMGEGGEGGDGDGDGDAPLRARFKRVDVGAPKPTPTPKTTPKSTPKQKPDRMAALRAAKMQMQMQSGGGGGAGAPLPPPVPLPQQMQAWSAGAAAGAGVGVGAGAAVDVEMDGHGDGVARGG